MPEPIFFDPTGRRRKAVNRSSYLLGFAAAVTTTVFVVSLLVVPFLPRLPRLGTPAHPLTRAGSYLLPGHQQRLSRHLLEHSRTQLWREIANSLRARPASAAVPTAPPKDTIIAAFYAIWQQSGLHSLRANADRITDLLPEWLHVNRNGTGLDFKDWDPEVTPNNREVVKIAREAGIDIHPVINNAERGAFDSVRVHHLLTSEGRQRALVRALKTFLTRERFQGLNVDFENLEPRDYARLPGFLARLRDMLHPLGLQLSVDVEANKRQLPLAEIAAVADWVVLMAYSEHSPYSLPGPIASVRWFDTTLARVARTVPIEKLVVGVGNYGLDWRTDRRGVGAAPLTYDAALTTASDFRSDDRPRDVVDFDPEALNPTFQYADDSARVHEVWLLDAVTAYNEIHIARSRGVRGAALWVMGSEDPALWRFYDRHFADSLPRPSEADTIPAPYGTVTEGDGEILSVSSTPHMGVRQTDVDSVTGLVTDEAYDQFPTSFVLRRSGYRPGMLAITFDDGPDNVYTPEILDVLHDFGVRATFFLIGQNLQRFPDVARRIFREGHEIGSHTFTHPNMAAVSERRRILEINTTQRALQSILGHSTVLFRPPYNADAEPTSAEEVEPIVLASRLGYVTVGELIDPQDWNLWKTDSLTGVRVQRTTDDIVSRVVRLVHDTTHANVILMHSAGGDRSRTVNALRQLIPLLQRQGYEFVTVSDLLGMSRDQVMPPIHAADVAVVGLDRVTFEGIYTFETLTGLAFVLAVGLAIARIAWVTPVAVVAHRRAKRQQWDETFRPPVTVLIAAYNERPVIARTIASALANDYPGLEVIVVDDGSTDGTGDEVEERYADDRRVHLIRQENAGKAAALNRAIVNAEGEVLVCFDADTQVAPNGIALLVRHFADPTVGAVAGNVKVGNRVNILTRWQSIEYITSQNLDRRAYAMMNAVTVVPGAVGAWRKSAVLAVGGYLTDTMAEDMELTWRLRRAGWRVTADAEPLAYTEAPDTLKGFWRQRFRWAYGSLQCLWKHRGTLFHYGWFGWLAVPTVWLFQVLFQTLGPLVDLKVLYTLGLFAYSAGTQAALNRDWQPLPQITRVLFDTLFFYGMFFGVDLIGAAVAFKLDREKLRDLWWLFWQRFVYRQMMYAVLWKSVMTAIKGKRQGWGKQERKGTVQLAAGTAA